MGVLISFSGIDGAGKSTQIKLLSEHLADKGKKVKSTEAMFGYFLLAPLVRLGRKATGSPQSGPVRRNKSFFGKLWFIPAFIDIWLGYIFKFRPMRGKFDFMLADRFYTDIWANLVYYGYLPNWAFDLVKLLPKADTALILWVKPEVGQKRASEFPFDYFEEQARIYHRLADQGDFYLVDANQDSKKVFAQIMSYLKTNAKIN